MYKKILKNKSFLGYWGSTTLMRLASNILQFALAIYVLDLTGSALVFSAVLSVIIFPRIIGTPIAGYLADFKDCLRILKLGALGLMSLMLSFFLIHTLINPLSVPLIYVLVICLELCETLISASDAKAIICIVDEDQLSAASKLSSLDDGIVEILSPVIAGFAYGLFGLQAVLLVTLISELGAFLLTLMLRPRANNRTENPGIVNKKSLFRSAMVSYKEAIASLREYNYLLGIILFAPLFNFFVSPLFSVTFSHFIRITLQSSIEVYTACNFALGIASVVAPFVAMWLIRDKAEHNANLGGTIICAFLMLIMSFVTKNLSSIQSGTLLSIVAGAMVLAVIIITIMSIATTITVKTSIPEQVLGRITSIIQLSAIVSTPLGQLLYGYFADRFSVFLSFTCSSLGLLATYMIMKKTYKKIKREKGKNGY
ncbi:MAG: MFS transporter [Lachnospiraceae bacterium]|nr:MFS transporter [Lachnospiraceae bacterium]